MSSPNKRVAGLNIMEVPRYDNGYGYAPVKARSVPARKPEIQVVARSQSHKVTPSRQPIPSAPYVAPLNIVRRKPVAQALGAEMYINRPSPPLPGSAAAVSRPQGIQKPSTIKTNKPLPPMPRPSPATNGVYTSTGQRIEAPIETSAWSNTTESTRAIRRRQKRDKTLQSHSATIVNAVQNSQPGKSTKAPELLKTHATVGKPGQDRNKVQDSRWAATQAACRYTHRQEQQMAQDRMAAARRVIIPSSSSAGRVGGIHKDTMKTREWMALSQEERIHVARQYEMDVVRMRKGSVGGGGGYVAPNAAAAKTGARGGRKHSSKCSVM